MSVKLFKYVVFLAVGLFCHSVFAMNALKVKQEMLGKKLQVSESTIKEMDMSPESESRVKVPAPTAVKQEDELALQEVQKSINESKLEDRIGEFIENMPRDTLAALTTNAPSIGVFQRNLKTFINDLSGLYGSKAGRMRLASLSDKDFGFAQYKDFVHDKKGSLAGLVQWTPLSIPVLKNALNLYQQLRSLYSNSAAVNAIQAAIAKQSEKIAPLSETAADIGQLQKILTDIFGFKYGREVVENIVIKGQTLAIKIRHLRVDSLTKDIK
jgi:hypothetical protein